MSRFQYFADIHMHPSMKAANSGRPKPKKNVWERIDHPKAKETNPGKLAENVTKDVAKYSQSNFYELAKGKVRVATASLYPVEKGFLRLRNIPNLMLNKRAKIELLQVINGFAPDSIEYMQKHEDYFKDLKEEYKLLYKNQGASPEGAYYYKLVNNYTELKAVLEKDEKGLAIILSVEGAHSLFNAKMLTEKLTPSEMKREITKNIEEIKSWEVPPFSMNLSHHFYNELCGHSKSFAGGTSTLLNQIKGLEAGLTGLGIKALKELVSENNGKRVIIDTKHMSVKGRIEYYNWIRSYNHISKTDKIPILCSHTGVSGYKTMKGGLREKDGPAKMNKHYFNKWNINLSDEEIKIIHETNGLIGIMLDKHKLGGGKFFKTFIDGIEDPAQLKAAYLKIFWDNIFQIVQAIGNKDGWRLICLGSDYDGVIEHIDPYDKSSTMPQFAEDLMNYLKSNKYQQQLWHGYEPEELVDKIMCQNALDFYERFFV